MYVFYLKDFFCFYQHYRSLSNPKTKEKRTILFNLAKSIQFCHQKGVLHKDLKLENIMVTPNLKTVLVDFGYSEKLPKPKGQSIKFCGTPFYVPPEFIKKDTIRGKTLAFFK